ncbi:uncharacterized protein LOC143360215 [Halictus rubicundus]|uniref:uncharacterized protein LOC143360215 n=1 Tax=Halictus rubicundus TaxID=77578 RepID=UPI00403712C6
MYDRMVPETTVRNVSQQCALETITREMALRLIPSRKIARTLAMQMGSYSPGCEAQPRGKLLLPGNESHIDSPREKYCDALSSIYKIVLCRPPLRFGCTVGIIPRRLSSRPRRHI